MNQETFRKPLKQGIQIDARGRAKVSGLQHESVFGPVDSRRFGCSLGVNLIPPEKKVCTFDCPYCECGRTDLYLQEEGGWDSFDWPRIADIVGHVSQTLESLNRARNQIDTITFAGNGEPTLYPDLLPLIENLTRIRSEQFPTARLVILTNGTRLKHRSVRRALRLFDEVCIKLDAGTESMYRRINQPLPDFRFDALIESIVGYSKPVIQSMFVNGSIDNTIEEEVNHWIHLIDRASPKRLDIFSLDRSSPDPGLTEVPRSTLELIAQKVRDQTRINVCVY